MDEFDLFQNLNEECVQAENETTRLEVEYTLKFAKAYLKSGGTVKSCECESNIASSNEYTAYKNAKSHSDGLKRLLSYMISKGGKS